MKTTQNASNGLADLSKLFNVETPCEQGSQRARKVLILHGLQHVQDGNRAGKALEGLTTLTVSVTAKGRVKARLGLEEKKFCFSVFPHRLPSSGIFCGNW